MRIATHSALILLLVATLHGCRDASSGESAELVHAHGTPVVRTSSWGADDRTVRDLLTEHIGPDWPRAQGEVERRASELGLDLDLPLRASWILPWRVVRETVDDGVVGSGFDFDSWVELFAADGAGEQGGSASWSATSSARSRPVIAPISELAMLPNMEAIESVLLSPFETRVREAAVNATASLYAALLQVMELERYARAPLGLPGSVEWSGSSSKASNGHVCGAGSYRYGCSIAAGGWVVDIRVDATDHPALEHAVRELASAKRDRTLARVLIEAAR